MKVYNFEMSAWREKVGITQECLSMGESDNQKFNYILIKIKIVVNNS